jgi:hypothetical protein
VNIGYGLIMSVLRAEYAPASAGFSDIAVGLEQIYLTESRRRIVAKRQGTAMATAQTDGMQRGA